MSSVLVKCKIYHSVYWVFAKNNKITVLVETIDCFNNNKRDLL